MKLPSNLPRVVLRGIVILLVIDLILVIWVSKKNLVTLTTMEYFSLLYETIFNWTGIFAWLIAFLWGIFSLFRGKPLQLIPFTQIIKKIFDRLTQHLYNLKVSLPIIIILFVLIPIFISQFKSESPYIPSCSTVLIAPIAPNVKDNSPKDTKMYVLDVNEDFLFELKSSFQNKYVIYDFKRGKPQMMAIAPNRKEIYVTVQGGPTGVVVVIDIDEARYVERKVITVGEAPKWIAITPDERKAYISNEKPIAQGSISVIDLSSKELVKNIRGVNSPGGLAITPEGKRLYVSSQCGGGNDPIFIIDTAADEIISKIPIVAAGTALSISPNGEKLYVSRGVDEVRRNSFIETIMNRDKISVIDLKTNNVITNLPFDARVLALTTDGSFLLAVDNSNLRVIDTKDYRLLHTSPVSSPPYGMAIAENSGVYVWLAEEPRMHVVGLGSLYVKSAMVDLDSKVNIEEIISQPEKFKYQECVIEGHITKVVDVPLLTMNFFKIYDGSGEIWVYTESGVPPKDRNVLVKGKLLSLGDAAKSTVIFRELFRRIGIKEMYFIELYEIKFI